MGVKSVVYRGSFRVKTEECKYHRLYRATPPGRDTVKGYKYRFLFIFFLTACFTSVLFFYNQFLLCVSKLLFVSMCVWQCSFFRITDKLLPFDLLSILILDKLCMNLLCLYIFFSF